MCRVHWAAIRISIGLFCVATMQVAAGGAEPAGGWSQLVGPGGSLEGWTAYHEDGAGREQVWSVDAEGVLSCKGSPLGYLATTAKYRDFQLELQYRWPEGGEPGKGGVLLRKSGPDKIWPKSLEAQINAGGAGDFWGLDGYMLEGPADRLQVLKHPKFGRLTNLRALRNVERPAGQWNAYRIEARGGTVTLKLNGQLVNRAEKCEIVTGPILLTAEGSPIEFRNLRIRVLTPGA